LTASLIEHGCRVERSFDLYSATTLRSQVACPCQFIVLLVYDQLEHTSATVITAYESEGLTRLKVESSLDEISTRLLAACDAVALQSAGS